MYLDEESISVLKALCDSFGPAGFERETASIVKGEASKYADHVFTDKLGSVIFVKKGSSDRPRVLIAGHIDEV
ncbi:MAG: peptidase M28, partial [Candidatus Bathyarchaeota archaeon]|nr:peptidase M28 [Candidatus Bathyarchaeota archaeon]